MQKVIHLVGENVKVELDGELDEALSITLGKRASARVRVRGHEIHESWPKPVDAQAPLQRADVKVPRCPVGQPVGSDSLLQPVHADDVQPVVSEHVGREEVGRELHDDDIAGLRELCARQIDPVAHSVRYHEALRPYASRFLLLGLRCERVLVGEEPRDGV